MNPFGPTKPPRAFSMRLLWPIKRIIGPEAIPQKREPKSLAAEPNRGDKKGPAGREPAPFVLPYGDTGEPSLAHTREVIDKNCRKRKSNSPSKWPFKACWNQTGFKLLIPFKISEPKTKQVAEVYKKWKAPENSLYVVEKKDPVFARASRNIQSVSLADAESLNALDCLRARHLFITPEAVEKLSKRLSKGGGVKS